MDEVRLDADRVELDTTRRVPAALLATAARERRTIHLPTPHRQITIVYCQLIVSLVHVIPFLLAFSEYSLPGT